MRWVWRLWLEEHGWGRIWTGLAMAIALAGGGLIYQQVTNDTPAAGNANLWVDTNGTGSCTRSSTAVAWNDSTSCQDFNEAFAAATCGDTVIVKNGSYATQSIDSTNPECTNANRVHINGESQAGVTMPRLEVTSVNPAASEGDRPGWVELQDMSVSGFTIIFYGKAVLRRIDGGSFFNNNADTENYGNDWGPCTFVDPAAGSNPCQDHGYMDEPRSVIMDGDVWHDFLINDAPPDDVHSECIQWFGMGTGNAVVRNTRFYNCVTYAIYFTEQGQQYVGNITIENNWFGRACNNFCDNEPTTNRVSAIMAGAGANLLIRYNSFTSGSTFMSEGGAATAFAPGSNVRAIGNIFGLIDSQNQCFSNMLYAYNAWLDDFGSFTCGATDVTVPSLPYVNGASGASGDYHLTGGTVTGIDNAVPNSGSDYALTVDKDGDTRPAGALRDAGADER